MSSQTLVVRADANVAIGTGHVMRCLALAQAWQDAGGGVVFAMAQSNPAIDERLRSEGVEIVKVDLSSGGTGDVAQLAEVARVHRANWVAVDGYQFDADYQRSVKDAGLKLLFIDDTGHAAHYHANLILNQNAHASEGLYCQREPCSRLLLGPRYAMLRREFAAWRGWQREIVPIGRKVLVTMGGSDPDNITLRVIRAIFLVAVEKLEATVIAGGSNPHIESLEHAASHQAGRIRLLRDATNMSELMAWADVAISAAGTTCWEICFLGLPGILIDVAPNQRPVAQELGRKAIAIHLGSAETVVPEEIAAKLESLLLSGELRAAMSECSRKMVDGLGAERVVSAMRGGSLRLRPAEERDCRQLWDWANDPAVRNASFSQAPIPWERHQAWFAGKLKDASCLILIAEDDSGRAVGQFRVDRRSSQEGEIDVSLSSDFRGAGSGSRFIDLGVRNVFETTGVERVHAFIRPENRASLRAFEGADFKKLGEEVVKGHAAIHYVRRRDQGRG